MSYIGNRDVSFPQHRLTPPLPTRSDPDQYELPTTVLLPAALWKYDLEQRA
jgi:hypothetical protein